MDFLDFFGFFFWIFWIFFGIFFGFFWIFWTFFSLDFWLFWNFPIFLDFFGFLGFLSKLLMLLLQVNKVTTGYQKLPKMGQYSIITSFFAWRAKKASAKGRSPPQELAVGPRSWPYLPVIANNGYVLMNLKK